MNHSSIIVKEGFPFIIASGIGTLIAYLAGAGWVAFFLLLITLFIVCFFRNPQRTAQENRFQVISPADGKVIRIEKVRDDDLSGEFVRKISIFMNVFNVHVNRMPCTGVVTLIRYKPGKFLSANLDKASEQNESNTLVVKRDDGQQIKIVQIAGLIARRIVCWVKVGTQVEKGERFGLIRFGSRVEVFMPLGANILVTVGDKVRAGETPIGEMR